MPLKILKSERFNSNYYKVLLHKRLTGAFLRAKRVQQFCLGAVNRFPSVTLFTPLPTSKRERAMDVMKSCVVLETWWGEKVHVFAIYNENFHQLVHTCVDMVWEGVYFGIMFLLFDGF